MSDDKPVITYTFDLLAICTVKVTTSAGEAAALRIANAIECVAVRHAPGLDCDHTAPEGTGIDVTLIAPRGSAALTYAEDADGSSVPGGSDGIAEPIEGDARELLGEALAAWRTAAAGPSGDTEHKAAALAAAVSEVLAS